MDQKYGIIMLGKIDGKTIIVAPYTEGRFSIGEYAYFSLPKGDPQTDDRSANANAEFHEETGIDIVKLTGNNNEYGNAKIVKRLINLPTQQYPASSGNPTELNLDIVIVDNIADLIPHLKGQEETLMPASELADQLGLPSFEEHLAYLHEHELPAEIDSADAFLKWVSDRDNKASIQEALDARRKELEEARLINDQTGIKFDNKINPGHYFQEGATIIPVERFEQSVRQFCTGHDDILANKFNKSMLGNEGTKGQLDAVLAAVEHAKTALRIPLETASKSVTRFNRG